MFLTSEFLLTPVALGGLDLDSLVLAAVLTAVGVGWWGLEYVFLWLARLPASPPELLVIDGEGSREGTMDLTP